MIDIARAKLPGGNVGSYQIGRGVSGLVLRQLAVPVEDFVEAVAQATDENEVASRFLSGRSRSEIRLLNQRLRRITVADVPDDLRPSFERFYGADLPPDKRVFDILEEDDRRAFASLPGVPK